MKSFRAPVLVIPPPYRQPEADAEFQALPVDRRTWVLAWWDHMAALDQVRHKLPLAEQIAESYLGSGAGEKRRGHGFSRTNLMRRYAAWVAAQRDWRVLDRYRTLRKPEALPVERYNLSPEAAKAFFKRRGLTQAEWAEARGLNPSAVGRALQGSRTTSASQRVLDLLAAEIREEPAAFHAELQAIKLQAHDLGARIARLERGLRRS